jgi:hypothetical protein
MEVIAQGSQIVIKVDGVETARYLDSHFKTGHIALQQHDANTVVEFRKIEIKESSAKTGSRLPVDPSRSNTFFNGKDLAGWEGLKGFWHVKDHALVGRVPEGAKSAHTFLCSKREFGDFELKFRARLAGGVGNSGFQFRSKFRDPKTFWLVGPQCEICVQDRNRKYPTGSLVTEPTGEPSVAPAAADVDRIFKLADFNDFEIRCVGRHVRIKLNGETTVDADFPSMPSKGLIGWQMHGKETPREVTFKDIEFTDLTGSSAQAAASSKSEAPADRDPRRVWVGVHRFENVSPGKWLETSPADPKETYHFDEVTRTPRYVELFDKSRAQGGCRIRLENLQVLIIWRGRDTTWRRLYDGKWVSP